MKKTFFTSLSLFILVLAFTTSCCARKNASHAKLNNKWQLVALQGDPLPQEARNMYVIFDLKAKSIGGRAACNSFGAPLTISKKGQLQIGTITSTRMACPGLLFESALFGALKATSRYEIDTNQHLKLYGEQSNQTPLAEFVIDPQENQDPQ